MDGVRLRRCRGEITFIKVMDTFAVRMKSGYARDMQTLSSASVRLPELDHVMALPNRLDFFSLKEAKRLDGAMQDLRAAPGVDVVSHVYQLDNSLASTVIPTGAIIKGARLQLLNRKQMMDYLI
jgi:hypothetical protein